MKIRIIIALGLMMTAPGCALTAAPAAEVSASPQALVDELLAADRGFASASANVDLADGLLAMFDPETVVPSPGGFARGPEAIRAVLKTNPANAGARATWTPVRGGISADGQHGFTLGFMTIRDQGGSTRLAKYLSYWVKRPAGWRVAAYKRTARPEGEVSLAMMAPSLPSRLVAPSSDAATLALHRASLDQAERSFSDDAQRIGVGPAFTKNGSADATNMSSGASFDVGNVTIGARSGHSTTSPTHWAPDEVLVASSGDLGITWGRSHANPTAPAGTPPVQIYSTIWRRSGPNEPWLYVAE